MYYITFIASTNIIIICFFLTGKSQKYTRLYAKSKEL